MKCGGFKQSRHTASTTQIKDRKRWVQQMGIQKPRSSPQVQSILPHVLLYHVNHRVQVRYQHVFTDGPRGVDVHLHTTSTTTWHRGTSTGSTIARPYSRKSPSAVSRNVALRQVHEDAGTVRQRTWMQWNQHIRGATFEWRSG